MIKYEKYKDSGYHWLGEIPNEWEIRRIKDFTYVKGRIGWQGLRSDDFLDYSEWHCVTGTDFKNGRINWKNCYYVDESRFLQDTKIQLEKLDLLITKDGTIGKIALINSLPKKATLNSGVFLTRPLKNKYNNEFMFWLLSSSTFKSFIDYNKNGSTILHLYQNVFERFFYCLPSLKEQTAIAYYLDKKTNGIDRKIDLLTKKITTYKELRKSLINQTITKGLDKNVTLKDTDIEWIGEIPVHWVVKRIKELATKIKTGTTPSSKDGDYFNKGTENWYTPVDIKNNVINSSSRKVLKKAFSDNQISLFKKNSIYLIGIGGTLGNVAISSVEASCNQQINVISFNEKLIFPKYSFYQMTIIGSTLLNWCNYTTMPIFTQTAAKQLELATPPLEEQTAIANYLDEKTSKIDAVVRNIESQTNTLKELRKTLINDVVTGKIKVVN
tara:strand:+ start:2853 stop:4175 length:1323 start_codon:yes stop_codon:yes gene_type:complete